MAIIIYGKNTVLEAIKTKRKVFELYILEGSNKDVVYEAKKQDILVVEMNKQTISNLLPRNNQGVGAKVVDYEYIEFEDALKNPIGFLFFQVF